MKNFLKDNKKKILIALFGIVSFIRIWLIYTTNWQVNIETYYDSHLQINQAVTILNRKWLGNYDKFTLCKNPIYPIFLAILYCLHIPYAYGIGLLMIVASLLFVKAIKPIIKNDYLEFIIYTFVLYNPGCLELTYHYRNSLLSWLVLMVIACVVAIYIRRKESTKTILPYAIIGMIATGAYWQLREDSIWLLPLIVMAYIISVISAIIEKNKVKKIITYSVVSLLPILGIFIFTTFISALNYRVYGIWATNDRMQTNTAKLIGTLISIDDGSDLDEDQWVSSKTIEIAKSVSPTFASLNLEPFDTWHKWGDYSIWALRDVLANSGYFVNAKETDEVCSTIIKEINEAFKEGKISKKKGIQLSDTSGVFSWNEVFKSFIPAFDVVRYQLTYSGVNNQIESVINAKDDIDLELYEEVLGISLVRDDAKISTDNSFYLSSQYLYRIQNQNHLRALYHNLFFSKIITAIYKYTDILLFVIATIGLIYLIYKLIKKDKKLEYKVESLIISIGLLLVAYLNAYLICLWATSFPADIFHNIVYDYTNVDCLLIALYEVFGTIYFIKFINEIINKKQTNK